MKPVWLTFALILLLSGCASLAAVKTNALPPAPQTPGAVITNEYICLPHNEAGDLLIWVEYAERVCHP